MRNVQIARGTGVATALAVENPIPQTVTAAKKTSLNTAPVLDEWGFYDPAQAGFEAVLRKLASRDEDDADDSSQRPSASAVSK